MAETKQLLYTLKIEGTQTELDRLVQIRTNIDNLGKDIKELGDTDKKAAEQKKLQLQQERKDYNELQKSIQNRNKAEQDSVKTLESMRAKLANLNKEMERIPVGTKAFEEQQKKAKALRDEINAVDQASGKWQGNVGNYKNAVIDAFQQMGINIRAITDNAEKFGSVIQTAGGSTSAAAGRVGVMTTALKYLRVAFIGLGIGAIVAAIRVLIVYFKGSQEGADKLTKALLPLKKVFGELVEFAENIGGALVKIFTGEAKQGIRDLGSAFKDLGGNISQAVDDAQRLYDIQLKLREASLTVVAQEANINRQIAERVKILDNENNSIEVRRQAAQEAVQWQEVLNKLKKDEAQLALDQFRLDNKNDMDLIENKRAVIELENKLVEIETEGLAATKKIRNQIYAIDKKAADDRLKAADDRLKATADQDEAERKRVEQAETYLKESIARVLEIKEQLKENAGDVIFKIVDEEEIDDIPNILQSLQELSAQEVALAKSTTEQIKGTYTQRLEALRGALQAGIISEEQYAARKMQINEMVLDDSIAALRGVAKEGSAISRALFIFEKALSVKKAFMAIIEGTSNTAKVGFPQNIPLLIGFAAQVAGLIGAIQGVVAPEPPKFARGVIGLDGPGTETSDSVDAKLSKGESVMTAKATRVFAPVLAEMERAVGNTPNVQLGNRRFAGGYIPLPTAVTGTDFNKAIREAVGSVAAIPVVVSEGDITSAQRNVRKIKVLGDL